MINDGIDRRVEVKIARTYQISNTCKHLNNINQENCEYCKQDEVWIDLGVFQ